MSQINDDAGEETRFSEPKQKTNRVEVPRLGNEGCHRCDNAPGHHNPADPLASAPTLDDQGPWDFQKEVTQKEDTGPKSDHCFSELGQCIGHRQLRDANIVSVNVGNDVANKQQRQCAKIDFTTSAS